MNTATYIIMCLVSVMLGLDVLTLTGVLHDLLIAGGSKPPNAVAFMVVYITHMLAFVGMCYATYEVSQS